MSIIADVSILIEALQALIKFVEAIDPNAATNPVVVKLQEAINTAQALNL